MLKEVISVTLKNSNTRRSLKKQAISTTHSNITSIFIIFNQIRYFTNLNYNTIDESKHILRLFDLNFLFLLNIWDKILMHIDKRNKCQQTKGIKINITNKMLNGLYNSI